MSPIRPREKEDLRPTPDAPVCPDCSAPAVWKVGSLLICAFGHQYEEDE